MTSGFLVVDKPRGISSHDVVARVRTATGIRKCGHTGTLDPMATGVVVVAVGGVTRLIRFLQDQDKEYVATACFGVATDTLDADGEELRRMSMAGLAEADLETIRPRFLGEIQQVPPMVSALKQDGRRLYDLARAGMEVEREPRTVTIHELEILGVEPAEHPLVTFRVVCGKGTYIRSLADDMAKQVGGYAHLTALRRTRNGTLTVEHAIDADDLADWSRQLVPAAAALSFLPAWQVDDEQARLIGNGRRLETSDRPPGLVRMVEQGGSLLAVYRVEAGIARPEVVLA